MTTLDILKQSREVLDKTYIYGKRDDGKGGHCALGAIDCIAHDDGENLAAAETVGKYAKQLLTEADFYAGNNPLLCVAMVNNCLGKQAILSVFDDAISALEVSALCEQVQAESNPIVDEPQEVTA